MSHDGLHLFQGYGVEIEYMIVRDDDLSVLPVCDEIIKAVLGEYGSDVEDGPVAWSNELVLHVLEFKTNGPAPALDGRAAEFQSQVERVNALLEPMGGRLLPTAMHPWMDPFTETRLWPHDNSVVYATYDRIFSCKGHGWANLQSAHLNLPFQGDDEFGRLHAAIRAVLPLLPALAASSPLTDGKLTGFLDGRLEVYRTNQRKVPLAAGQVIPERAWSKGEYHARILEPLWEQVAPLDPDGVLRHEWLNSRGAIARFDRDAIEIRVLDTQEAPVADLAIHFLVSETLKALIAERWAPLDAVRALEMEPLAQRFRDAVRTADATSVDDAAYLALFGLSAPCTIGDVWAHLAESVLPAPSTHELASTARTLVHRGPLARRIVAALGPDPSRSRMTDVYRDLADCLAAGRLFGP